MAACLLLERLYWAINRYISRILNTFVQLIRTNMRNTLFFISIITLVFTSCKNNADNKKQEIKEEKQTVRYLKEYDSAEKYPDWPGGRALKYSIDKMYPSNDLSSIMDSIVKTDNGRHSIIAVNWFYDDKFGTDEFSMNRNLYATSFFNGEIETINKDESEEYYKNHPNEGAEKETIGSWHDNVLNAAIYINKLPDSQFQLEYLYGLSGKVAIPLLRDKLKGKEIYTVVGQEDGFLSIDPKDGALRVYDKKSLKNIISYNK